MPAKTTKKPAAAPKAATKKTTTARKKKPVPEARPPIALQFKPVSLSPSIVAAAAVDSPTQVGDRHNRTTVLRYALTMARGEWEWDRAHSQPMLVQDYDGKYHGADLHHRGLAIDLIIAILEGEEREESAQDQEMIEAIESALNNQPTMPLLIPCLVAVGTVWDAHRYSRREANRYNGLGRTPQQRSGACRDILRDRELIRDVARWIAERLAESSLEPVEAIWEGLQDSIPGARAIAAYLGDISHPTVQGIWSNQAALYGDKYPWLLETKLIGLDGLGYEVEARPAIPAAPSDAPASNKVVNLPVVQPIAPPPKTATAPDPKPRSENSSTTEAAPTDSAPIAPIQTYTGEARKHRVRELAEKFAGEIVLTLAPEMQLSLTITEICENLVVAITDELMVGVGLLTIGVVDRE